MPFVAGVGRELDDGYVARPAHISKRFLDALWIFILLVGDKNFKIGVPRIVGIAVGEKIDAALASSANNVNVIRRFAPDRDRTQFDMRMLDGDVRSLSDGDFFLQSLKSFVSLV